MFLTAVVLAVLPGHDLEAARTAQPALGDREFWALIEGFSESGGQFQSDNLVSNEAEYLAVVPSLAAMPRGGAYIGVAPDQNFAYVLALEPAIAFVVDIRRDNLLLHLLFKAAMEMSNDRLAFLGLWFGRQRPAGIEESAPVADLLAAVARQRAEPRLADAGLDAMLRHLGSVHGFPLSAADRAGLRRIHAAFVRYGPAITYASTDGRGPRDMPSYADLQVAVDPTGTPRSYLNSGQAFARLKQYQAANLIVPVVGDFAGPDALRAIGGYLAARGLQVGGLYASNVEQYLFQEGRWRAFYRNVAALPYADHSVLIRAAERSSFVDAIPLLLADVERGRIHTYADITRRRPPR